MQTNNFRQASRIYGREFPYTASTTAYIVLDPLRGAWAPEPEDLPAVAQQLSQGRVQVLAVWPGRVRSDVFIIDDPQAFQEALESDDSDV